MSGLPYVVLTARNFAVAARFATMQHAKAFSEQQLPGSHVVIDHPWEKDKK